MYVASTLSFLPRNIASLGSLQQPDLFPPTAAAAGSLTPTRDEEGGSTPVLDEPEDDDLTVGSNYGTAVGLGDGGKSLSVPQSLGAPHGGTPEFAYRIVQVNDGLISSQLPDDSASVPGTFAPEGTIVYRTEVVDGFQSASEAFHPPPDFFRSETDFTIPPPPMTIYQVKGEDGYSPASESVPMLSSSARDVVYTVVTTVQQPQPPLTSFYPVVIEVPSFTEPPPKVSTYPAPPASFVHPPPAVFNPSLPPPTLTPTNLPPPPLPPLPAPAQPVSLQYTVPPPVSIQVVVPPHTLRSPLPAPPKSTGPPPIYAPKRVTSEQTLVPTVRTSHPPDSGKKTSASSYRPDSVLQGIRFLRDIQQKESSSGGTSAASVIPTIGGNVGSRYVPARQKSPVAVRQVPSLLSLKPPAPPEEVTRSFSKFTEGQQQSAVFAGSKRRLSGSVSEDSVLKPETAKVIRDAEAEMDIGQVDEELAGQLTDENISEDVASDTGDNCEYDDSADEGAQQIPSLLDRKPPFRGSYRGPILPRGAPRLLGIQRSQMGQPILIRPRMPRIPRLSGPVFRGGPRQFWTGRQ